MESAVDNRIDRRDLLRGSILLGVGALLQGCAGSGGASPPVIWPSERTGAARPATPPTPSPNAYPPPRPSPSSIHVHARSEWTNQGIIQRNLTSNGDGGRMGLITRITVHHDAVDNAGIRTEGDAIKRLNAIRNGHVTRRSQPFADIGYHYVIDPRGDIWEGRSTYYQGAHVKGQNENNLGIVLMGHFDYNRPTPAALAALDAFVIQTMQRYNIPVSRVKTHQEMAATECPGRNLQRQMLATRSRGGAIYRA